MARIKAFFLKNYIVVGIIVLIAAAGGAYWYVSTANPPAFGSVTVGRGNVIEAVDEAGTVDAENSATLSFQESGQIAHVYVNEGSQVSAGTVLADLDSAQLSAAAQQAAAALTGAQAQLALLQSGTRPEQLTIDEATVSSTDQALGIAVENAYGASDDAVRNQIDTMFSNPDSSNPGFLVMPNSGSQGMVTAIEDQRVAIGGTLGVWYAALNATSTGFDPASISGTAETNLQQIDAYINAVALIVNSAQPNSTVTAANLAAYKAAVATARAEIEASISAVSGDQSAFTAAQNQLALAQAGSTPQAIQAQEAVVAQAQAAASSAQVALSNASLVAPFPGTIQNLTAQVGQVVSPAVPVMSLINNSGLKIEAYVSEKDVANIQQGDTALVTLDAFGTGTTFPATVTTVDAAETQVNGSAAYLVTLHFVNPDSQIKDGMTGNVHILEAEHDNVIAVPSNLVINDAGNYFVLVQRNGTVEQQSVQVGLVGASTTEIVSGLNVGDQINSF